ncbi:hypothetical protein [Curtobacterium sp. UCD-KPL2560]|uniref:hypothetical protein n=1 Tax=Curtobacterium sp. UCD-KPL2560 TaxID=1885315 RepID=UPI0008251CF0|nr:hypothetical protein [Curtobacterium sp. UCD-KPL2560]
MTGSDSDSVSDDIESAYVFDPTDGAAVAPALDEAVRVESSTTPDLMAIAFRWERAAEDDRERARDHAISRALSYELSEDETDPGKITLEPYAATEAAWMRPLRNTLPVTTDLWEAVGDAVEQPALVAHFADLLWTVRRRTGLDAGRDVADAYLALEEDETLQWVVGTARANTIARNLKLAPQEESARRRLLEFAERNLDDTDLAGLTLRALDVLTVPPRSATVDALRRRVEKLLDRAWKLFNGGGLNTDALARSALRFAEDDEGRRDAQRLHVNSYMSGALVESGFREIWMLNEAAKLASGYGLITERDRAVISLQRVDQSTVPWHRHDLPLTIPKWTVAHTLRPYRQARHWTDALETWLRSAAPTGSRIANEKLAREQGSGLLALVTQVEFGGHGLPQKTHRTDEAVLRRQRRLEEYNALVRGTLLASALEHIAARFPNLDEEGIAAHLLQYGADEQLTRAFAHALAVFLSGNFSDAGALATPLAEAASRGMLLLLDEPLYRVESGSSAGRFPALDLYLNALLKNGLDPDWDRALRIVLTPEGFDLRNSLAHGFKLSFNRTEAALALRVAGLMVLLTSPDLTSRDAAWARSKLQTPVPQPLPLRWRFVRV